MSSSIRAFYWQSCRPLSSKSFLDTSRNSTGMQPVSWLPASIRLPRFVKLLKEAGILPVNRLPSSQSSVNPERLPSHDGISPVNPLLDKSESPVP